MLYTLHCNAGILFHFIVEDTEKFICLEGDRFDGGRLRTQASTKVHALPSAPSPAGSWEPALEGPPGGHTGGEVGAGGLLLCTGQLPSDQRGNQCYLGTLCLFMLKPISVAGFGGGIV